MAELKRQFVTIMLDAAEKADGQPWSAAKKALFENELSKAVGQLVINAKIDPYEHRECTSFFNNRCMATKEMDQCYCCGDSAKCERSHAFPA